MSGPQQLAQAFEHLDATLPVAQFPLPLDGSTELRQLATSLANQLRDYLLPRAAALDAPLLAVVGGSTGAGKSTIVNSILGAALTRPGVLRPTTKSPVLICHPDDANWFRSGRTLPGLVRSETQVHDSRALQIVPFAGLPSGLALLDAPDIDSVDDENRRLARQLLQAADLWLFVTSAARYADLVGWEVLAQAAARNAVVSVVLNRCPPESMQDLLGHLGQMLAERGVHAARLFAVAEHHLGDDGMVPPAEVQPIRGWLGGLAAQSEARADVAVQTLAGTVKAIDPQLRALAAGARRQVEAVADLRRGAEQQFRDARDAIARATSDGTMLRGEVLSRWQDFVGTGEFMRGIEKQISAWRDRLTGWFRGEQQAAEVQVAISDGLAALIVEHGQAACENAVSHWSLTPWGRDIVSVSPELARPTPDFNEMATRTIREWQAGVLELVSEEGRGKRVKARILALGTNAIGAALIILVFATTGGLTTAEVGIAGGTSLLAQRILEGVFGEDAVRRLATRAKADLDARIEGLLATQLARFEDVLATLSIEDAAAARLEDAADQLQAASRGAFDDLTRPEGY
ncbi:ABC transporter [Tessaracoccus sp. OS52]|uniref:ABC transporter n=1 Tax=Tessaracoccus sp. OS52 TaxID=2886691 RepID=UPI001D0F50A5|nr:ABC transporter [Tessaracoccus sp. OS52]MCC2592419.1 ABC transporter [Tessaracoccus sp. OS52]